MPAMPEIQTVTRSATTAEAPRSFHSTRKRFGRTAVAFLATAALFGAAPGTEARAEGSESAESTDADKGRLAVDTDAKADSPFTFKPSDSKTTLVVYCGRSESLVGNILEQFEVVTGIQLDVRFNSTGALAAQMLTEGAESAADVIFLQESGYLGALAAADRLEELPEALTKQIDPRFRSTDNRWLGTSARARVLVYNHTMVDADDMPKSLKDLGDPRWKGKLGWAPGNASFHAHVSALRHLWGEDETRDWLKAMKANSPILYPKNSPQVIAAEAGEIAIGWVNHYYLHRLADDDFQASNYSFPTAGDAGNVLMVSGAAIRKDTKNKAAALAFLEFLASEPIQKEFAKNGFEYPARPGVPVHEDVTPIEDLNLAEVNQEHLVDIGPTLDMLRKLGLQ